MKKRVSESLIPIAIGERKTGKTTFFLNNFLLEYAKKRKVLIIDKDGRDDAYMDFPVIDACNPLHYQNWNNGILRANFESYEILHKHKKKDFFAYINQYFTDGFLVLDDVKAMTGDHPTAHFNTLMNRGRHGEIDIGMMVHSFNDLPMKVYQYFTEAFIFPAADIISKSRHKDLNETIFNQLLALNTKANNRDLKVIFTDQETEIKYYEPAHFSKYFN